MKRLFTLVVVLLASPVFAQDTIQVQHPTFTPITFAANAPQDLTSIVKFRLYVDGQIVGEVLATQVTAGAEFAWTTLPQLAKGTHVVFCEAVGSIGGVDVVARGINPSSLSVSVEGPASPN